MHTLETRKMLGDDVPAVAALLDSAIGRGFWDPKLDLSDITRVAVVDGRVVGVGSASVHPESPQAIALPVPVGHVRLVAVDPCARRRGVATRLVCELSRECELAGAASFVAYAWVHAPVGVAPLAGALEAAGYVFDHRIEGFYAGAAGARCPACQQSPCVCPADVYGRIGASAKS